MESLTGVLSQGEVESLDPSLTEKLERHLARTATESAKLQAQLLSLKEENEALTKKPFTTPVPSETTSIAYQENLPYSPTDHTLPFHNPHYEEVQKLKVALAAIESQKNWAENNLSVAHSNINSKNSENKILKESLERAYEMVKSKQRDYFQASEDLQVIKTELLGEKLAQRKLQDEISHFQNEAENSKVQLSEERKRHDAIRDRLMKEAREEREKNNDLEMEMTHFKERETNMIGQNSDLKIKLEKSNAKIEQAAKEFAAAELAKGRELSALNEVIEAYKQEIQQAKETAAELLQTSKQLESAGDLATGQTAKLNVEVTALKSQNAELLEQNEEFKEQLKLANDILGEKDNEMVGANVLENIDDLAPAAAKVAKILKECLTSLFFDRIIFFETELSCLLLILTAFFLYILFILEFVITKV